VKPTTAGASLSDEHPALIEVALAVIRQLAGVPQSLAGSPWQHHHEYAKRAAHLSEHLGAAIALATSRRYASALAVARIALEQGCVDELLLLADRYRETIPADVAAYRQLEAEWQRGEADWAESVVELKYANSAARLVRKGHSVRSQDGIIVEHVSPYEPVLDEHKALLGPPRVQDELAGPFSDPEQLKKWARRSQVAYHQYLSWSGILDNLQLNELVTARQTLELDTHYRFLSTFVHATTAGYRALDPQRGFPGAQYLRDHLLGELALLYVSAIGVTELKSFIAYVDARGHLEMTTRAEVEQAVSTAGEVISYFWFPRLGSPVPYDFFTEANRRAYPNGQFERDMRAPRPDEIPAAEVSYYANPLGRLEQLHLAGAEVSTGYSHVPMWP
jgi:hypothetical protein